MWGDSMKRGTDGGRVTTLALMRAGERGRVAALDGSDPARLKKLIALGLGVGAAIEVVQRAPVIVIRAGHATLGLDARAAAGVLVRRAGGTGRPASFQNGRPRPPSRK